MERYTICVVFLLRILGDTRALFQTTLNPPPPTLKVCPGENYTLSCTVRGTPSILWNWNNITMRDYISGLDKNINTTDLLLSNNNMMVSTRLLLINSSQVHSQLEFTLFENVTLVNVWCNRVMITIQNGECSTIRENFRILGLRVLLNSSILTFAWEVFPACFISAVISNNNFSRDIDNGRPLELESPNEHHNIDLMLPCNNDLFARINITQVSDTTRFMTINIAKRHLAEGENIHVVSAQQNSDTQYYEWIWPKNSSDLYHFDNSTSTGTSNIATEYNMCANNNNYQLIILPVVFCFSLVLLIISVIFFSITFVMIKNRNKRAKDRSNNLMKCLTTPQHPSTPTYEEVKVDHHSEATEMTTNSAYGFQNTQDY